VIIYEKTLLSKSGLVIAPMMGCLDSEGHQRISNPALNINLSKVAFGVAVAVSNQSL
jgi:hypothetical protein